MLATSILAGATFAAVGGDIPFARASQDRKQAYAAAEAGDRVLPLPAGPRQRLLDQLHRRRRTRATASPARSTWPTRARARTWRTIAGSADSQFSIELLPANGAATCDTTKPEETMLDTSSGTFRIRSTGESRGVRRSIVATFRRTSFLDYLYFTDFETSDPLTLPERDRPADAATTASSTAPRATRSVVRARTTAQHHVPGLGRHQRPAAHERRPADLRLAGLRAQRGGQDRPDRDLRARPERLPAWRRRLRAARRLLRPRAPRRPKLPVPTSNKRLDARPPTGYLFYGPDDDHASTATATMDVSTTYPTTGAAITDDQHGAARRTASSTSSKVGPACSIDAPRQLDYNDGRGLRDPDRARHLREVDDARLGGRHPDRRRPRRSIRRPLGARPHRPALRARQARRDGDCRRHQPDRAR